MLVHNLSKRNVHLFGEHNVYFCKNSFYYGNTKNNN